jgi:flagellar biosynthesis/type III secretory pathway protein FliH
MFNTANAVQQLIAEAVRDTPAIQQTLAAELRPLIREIIVQELPQILAEQGATVSALVDRVLAASLTATSQQRARVRETFAPVPSTPADPDAPGAPGQ